MRKQASIVSASPEDCRSVTEQLDGLAEDFETRGRLAAAAYLHLTRLRPAQKRCAAGPYRVFRIEATRQLVVLRDVAALDSATCVHECAAFADALAWVNQRLATELAPAPA
ncbi:MAG: hypothetical protein HZA32_03060 [Opitutae bacterium]|nr:hypothetical protein [Opitutae bacterium]